MIHVNVFAMCIINMQQNNSFHDVNSNNEYIVPLIIYLLISSSPITVSLILRFPPYICSG